MNALVAYIRELRKARGLTQEQLALEIGVSPRQMVRIENHGHAWKADALLRAVKVLCASLEDIQLLATDTSLTTEDAKNLAIDCATKKKPLEAELKHGDSESQLCCALELALQLHAQGGLDEWVEVGRKLVK